MTETPDIFARHAFERASAIVRSASTQFPHLTKPQLVMLMASALGVAMGEESFPELPKWDFSNLVRICGASAGVRVRGLIQSEKNNCRGNA